MNQYPNSGVARRSVESPSVVFQPLTSARHLIDVRWAFRATRTNLNLIRVGSDRRIIYPCGAGCDTLIADSAVGTAPWLVTNEGPS